MNGKSINSIANDSLDDSSVFNNNSNLTIKNSSKNESSIKALEVIIRNKENATLSLDNVRLICNETRLPKSTIYNSGKLIIKNAYIEGPYGIGGNDSETATFDISDSEIVGTLANGIQLNSGSRANGNIYNSTITGKKSAILSYNTGTLNIYSGTFIGETEYGIVNYSTGTINICSGEIRGSTYDLNNSSTGIINYTSKVTLKNNTKNGTNVNLTDSITCK